MATRRRAATKQRPATIKRPSTQPKQRTTPHSAQLPPDRFLPAELEFYLPLVEVCLQLPRVLSARSERAFGSPFNISAALAYLTVAEPQGMSMSELSRILNLSNSRVTRLVHEMESAGWVARSKSKIDGRSNLAKITASGRRKLAAEGPFHIANIRELAIYVFNSRERALLLPYLERLSAHLRSSS